MLLNIPQYDNLHPSYSLKPNTERQKIIIHGARARRYLSPTQKTEASQPPTTKQQIIMKKLITILFLSPILAALSNQTYAQERVEVGPLTLKNLADQSSAVITFKSKGQIYTYFTEQRTAYSVHAFCDFRVISGKVHPKAIKNNCIEIEFPEGNSLNIGVHIPAKDQTYVLFLSKEKEYYIPITRGNYGLFFIDNQGHVVYLDSYICNLAQDSSFRINCMNDRVNKEDLIREIEKFKINEYEPSWEGKVNKSFLGVSSVPDR